MNKKCYLLIIAMLFAILFIPIVSFSETINIVYNDIDYGASVYDANGELIGILLNGTKIHLVEQTQDKNCNQKIVLPNFDNDVFDEMYVYMNFDETALDEGEKYEYVTGIIGFSCDVYSYPSKESKVINHINKNERITLCGRIGDWYYIDVNDIIGYIPTTKIIAFATTSDFCNYRKDMMSYSILYFWNGAKNFEGKIILEDEAVQNANQVLIEVFGETVQSVNECTVEVELECIHSEGIFWTFCFTKAEHLSADYIVRINAKTGEICNYSCFN